jgi:hypothetical protein
MRENFSRRKALSLLGTALGLGLALTGAEAQTAGTKSHHTKHPKRPNVQPATPPAAAAGPMWHENPNGTSAVQHEMEEQYRQY